MGIERVSLLFKDCVCLIFCASLQFLGAKAPLYLAKFSDAFTKKFENCNKMLDKFRYNQISSNIVRYSQIWFSDYFKGVSRVLHWCFLGVLKGVLKVFQGKSL